MLDIVFTSHHARLLYSWNAAANPAFITPLKGRLHVPKVSTNHLAQQCQSSCCRQPNHEWFTPLQASSRSALGWTSSRVGGGTRHASSPSRTRSSVSQRGGFSLSGTLEEGTPPVELGSSPPGGSDSRRPAWVVPGTSLLKDLPFMLKSQSPVW